MMHSLHKEPSAPGKRARYRRAWIALALLFAPALAWGGIASTKHNLTGTDGGPMMNVCIFCHTPAGDPNAAAEPTWNLNGGDGNTTFTTFDDLGRLDPNRDGVSGTVSVACLSCHDDAQAFGVTLNTASDHPVGVAYRGANVAGIDLDNLPPTSTDSTGAFTYVQGSENAPAIFANSPGIADADFKPAVRGTADGNPIFYVKTIASDPDPAIRQRTDIKLYSRHFAGDIVVPFVECASCHDPHTETSTFLRVENSGSALCMSCHDI